MTTVRAVRGAIQIERDEVGVIQAETAALLTELIRRNRLRDEDIISFFFTMTQDLASGFPAEAARAIGLTDVPLMCATEIDVPGALPRVIRVLAHILTDRSPAEVEHVYLGGAARLRPDLVDRPERAA